jgi:tetratricopeptide (TPR) repeat protein
VSRIIPVLLLLAAAAAPGQQGADVRRLADSARARLAEQKYAEAARDYEALLKVRPQDAEARFALGVCYTQLDRLAAAATELRRYVALDPRSAEGRAALGAVLMAQGLPEEARPQLELALRLDPSQADAAKDLARCYDLTGEPGKAVHLLRTLVSTSPEDREARHLLAVALLNSGDAQGVARELDRLPAAGQPPSPEIYILSARVQQKLGNYEQALELCERGMRLYPYAPRLESVYFALPQEALTNRLETRLQQLEAAPSPDPEEITAVVRAIIDWFPDAEQKGRRTEMAIAAEELAARAVSARPRDPWTRFQYARLLSILRKYPEAAAAFQAALAMKPDAELQVLIHTRLASVEQKQSHPERAHDGFRTALAINRTLPKPNPDAACDYAKFLREEAQPAAAVAVVEEALRWAPFHVPARLERATLLAGSHRWNEVINEATFVVRNTEDDKLLRAAHYLLSRAYHVTGDEVRSKRSQTWLKSHAGAR